MSKLRTVQTEDNRSQTERGKVMWNEPVVMDGNWKYEYKLSF